MSENVRNFFTPKGRRSHDTTLYDIVDAEEISALKAEVGKGTPYSAQGALDKERIFRRNKIGRS